MSYNIHFSDVESSDSAIYNFCTITEICKCFFREIFVSFPKLFRYFNFNKVFLVQAAREESNI